MTEWLIDQPSVALLLGAMAGRPHGDKDESAPR